jgi:hypothetical protein
VLRGYLVVKRHEVPPFADVTPAVFLARTCQE